MTAVILPIYNQEKYLAKALDSLLAQTYTDWIAICVDDGSTDATPRILRDYAARDGRFKILAKANGGVSSARNAGLDALARTPEVTHVAFLDPDDAYHPQCLELAHAAARSCPDAVVIWHMSGGDLSDLLVRRYVSAGSAQETGDGGPSVCDKLFPRCAVEGTRFCLQATVGEDIAFLVKVVHLRHAQFVRIAPVLYWYRERPGSAMHRSLHVRDFMARTAVIEDMMATLADDRAAQLRYCRDELPGLLKQFWRHLRQVVPEERADAEREFASELRNLKSRGQLLPQRGSLKDLKYHLRFLWMARRVR